MSRMLKLFAFVAIAFSSGCGGSTIAPAEIVIHRVSVVDVVGGTVLPDRTVVVRAGKIDKILEGDVDLAGADVGTVIDGAGRFVIPGLWDAHVHFRGGQELLEENRALLPLYIANGVTTVRDAGGDITEAVLEWRGQIASGELVGPRIITSGPKLDGPTGGWDGSIRLASLEEVPAALDSLEHLGADYVKIYDGTTSRDVYLAVVEEAERRGQVVSGHMPFSVLFDEAVASGLDITDHLYYVFKGTVANEDSLTQAIIERRGPSFWNALWLMMQARDPERERATYAAMAEAGTAAVPTLHIGRVLSHLELEDHSEDPELRYIDPEIEATYAGRLQSALRSSAETRRLNRELRQIFIEMVPAMHQAGVTILAGSDAGPFNSYVYPGFSLQDEVAALAAAGLSPLEALRAATIEPARVLGVDDRLGQVAEGYEADLVVLTGNPLEDISRTRDIDRVIVRGTQVFGPSDLQTLLDGVARPDPPTTP